MAGRTGSPSNINAYKVKLLLYTTNYWPEVTGSGKYNGELAAWFAQRGHTIDVITAPPHYPRWKVAEAYRNKGWFTELADGVHIHRSPLYVPDIPGGKGRILQETSFTLSSFPYWLRALFRRYDAVLAVCPPLQAGLFPFVYSRLKSVPFVFHIQDLQVDVAVQLNMIRNRQLIWLLSRIEHFLLTRAQVVSSISEGMKRNILNKGVRDDQYFMLPNWTDLSFIKPLSREVSMRAKLGVAPHEFVVLYSGNLGEKQGVSLIIDAATRLAETPAIRFIICGDGVASSQLQLLADTRKLKSVIFLPLQPYTLLPELLATADVHLIVQKRAASDIVMPSKLTTILGAGGASIVTADTGSSLASIILDNKLGWVVLPEDAVLLADQIVACMSSPFLDLYKINARRYAETYLGKDAILERLETMLMSLC